MVQAAAWLDGLPAPQARINHGFALLGLGQAALALSDFDAAGAFLPANDEACFGRGLALESLGRRAEGGRGFHGIAGTLTRSLGLRRQRASICAAFASRL